MTSEFGLAVHALVFLDHERETVSSETLAVNICTNPARVRKVMVRLKRAGLIETKEGAEGGYRFLRDAAAVSLRQVADALGMTFVAANWRSGDADMPCRIASGMADVMDGLYAELNGVCLDRLREITIAEVSRRIFLRKSRLGAGAATGRPVSALRGKDG